MSQSPEGGRGGELGNKEGNARNSWVRGYLEGNAYLPQTQTGIHLFLAHEVVNDPPDNWKNFEYAKLSGDQREKGDRLMTALHRASGITTKSKQYTVVEDTGADRVMSPKNRFIRLWELSRDNVSKLLALYANIGKDPAETLFVESFEVLNLFFQDEANKQKIADLKLILNTAVGVARGESVKALALKLREGFDPRTPRPTDNKAEQNQLKNQIIITIIEETKQALPDMNQEMLGDFLYELLSNSPTKPERLL